MEHDKPRFIKREVSAGDLLHITTVLIGLIGFFFVFRSDYLILAKDVARHEITINQIAATENRLAENQAVVGEALKSANRLIEILIARDKNKP